MVREGAAASPLGMSTSWNAAATKDGKRIVEEIMSLGFRVLEVDYRVSAEAARDIRGLVEAGTIRVASVHNFSPLRPGELPSNRGGHKLSLATPDEAERRSAVELTLVSADLARGLGAHALVLHLGETDLGREWFKELAEVIRSAGVTAQAAEAMREQVRAARQARVAPHMDAALRSLEEIVAALDGSGIVACIENRNYYHQIPLPEEVLEIKRQIPSDSLKYWHDVGHAHIMEVLGFRPHLENLELLRPHLYGTHLHDCRFTRDHIAPGTGDIDFAAILKRIPDSALKVLELAPISTRDEIVKGIAYLESLGVSPSI
jgi:sugar phosphate isomerase/epimerase